MQAKFHVLRNAIRRINIWTDDAHPLLMGTWVNQVSCAGY